jgi:glutaminyl-peptide cyclotransferase
MDMKTPLYILSIIAISFLGTIDGVQHWQVQKIREYPSDPTAFTQGLLFENGYFYLSTGLFGKSSLRKIHSETGKTVLLTSLDSHYFGEGITKVDDTIYQLTWKNGRALAYKEGDTEFERDLSNDFSYPHQGWGITTDGANLIISDGSSTIRFLSKDDKTLVKILEVTLNGTPIRYINELEYIHGKLFANLLNTHTIVVIDPSDGKITDLITVDLDQLFSPQENPLKNNQAAILNGIAFDLKKSRLFITGKLWPSIFEVSLEPIPHPAIPVKNYFYS